MCHGVEVPGRPGDEGKSPAFISKAALLRYLRRHDAEMHTDPPTGRLNEIRRCAERAAAAELGKPSIDGDQLVLHHDYAFALQEEAATDSPTLWIGRLVLITMRKQGCRAAVYRRPVDLASEISGLELCWSCPATGIVQ